MSSPVMVKRSPTILYLGSHLVSSALSGGTGLGFIISAILASMSFPSLTRSVLASVLTASIRSPRTLTILVPRLAMSVFVAMVSLMPPIASALVLDKLLFQKKPTTRPTMMTTATMHHTMVLIKDVGAAFSATAFASATTFASAAGAPPAGAPPAGAPGNADMVLSFVLVVFVGNKLPQCTCIKVKQPIVNELFRYVQTLA